jgi:hypothetical protein
MAGDEQVFYASSSGDMWLLVRAEGTDTINVKHRTTGILGRKSIAHDIEKPSICALQAATRRLNQLIGTMIGEERDRNFVFEAT